MGRQKRSENTYQKINTIFYRDENNIIMPYDEFVTPELEYLKDCKFDCEEKIDGCCIRIEIDYTQICFPDTIVPYKIIWNVTYKGKTDNANIPSMLLEHLRNTYPEDKVLNALGLTKEMCFSDEFVIQKGWSDGESFNMIKIPNRYTLYGEGYGVKIQGCGGNYLSKTNSFIGFDVKVDNIYLLRKNRDDIFNKLNCPIVPFIGQFTIDEAIEYVKKGFKSNISENKDFFAEGLVCRTPIGLTDRLGNRIIFKVKTCDWNKYFAKYGTYDKVEQHRNQNV